MNKKIKYASVNGFLKSILNGIKKIADYTILKKILLLGFFASSMFIVYAVCNITGIKNIEETDFITMNKNYLQVEMESTSVDKFLEYEELACIDYIIPGDSMVSFKMKFDKYYQTARNTVEITGSLVSDDKISEEDIAILLSSENGQKKYIDKCNNAKYRAIINKVDNEELLSKAEIICKYLSEKGVQGVITSYRG